MTQDDPFDSLLFLEDEYFAQGKEEGIRYVVPASWFQGYLTGLEECFSFVAYVERHKGAAELIVQLETILPPQSFDFIALKKLLEKLQNLEDDSRLYEDTELRKCVYNLCKRLQKLLEPIQFVEQQLFTESELNF